MRKFFNGVRAKGAALAGLVGAALFGSAAMAGPLSESIITELTDGKTEILAVGGAILILVGVVALIRHVRSAAR